mgnify:CR=1 FL=1
MRALILDVETTISNKGNPFDQTNKLCLVGLASIDSSVEVFSIEYTDEPYKDNLNKIQKAIDNADILVGFNIKFDLHWLKRYGIVFHNKRIWDCQVTEFILKGQQQTYPSLNGVCESYGLETKLDEVKEEYWKNGIDTPEIPKDLLFDYLVKDVELTKEVYKKQLAVVQDNPRIRHLISLHNQDLLVLEEMEYNGILYDQDWSEVLGNELEDQIDKLNKKLYDYHNYDDFNPNSVDHLSAFLYGGTIKNKRKVLVGVYKTGDKKGQDKYQWQDYTIDMPRLVTPLKNTELAKEGLYSTDDATLKSLKGSAKAQEVLDIIMTRSTLEKRLTTYYRGLNKLIDEQHWKKGTIHGQLNQCVARTGRLSSSKPNLQNFDGEIKTLFKTRYEESI